MLIFDELKKNDPQLRLVAMIFAGGLALLLAGLWWVQIVSAHKYQAHLETQAYRTIRIPATRGKIFDREGRVLAENRSGYNLCLYLDDDDLGKRFRAENGQLLKLAREAQARAIAEQEKKLRRGLTKDERKRFALTPQQLGFIQQQARIDVAAKIVEKVSVLMNEPIPFDAKGFEKAYERQRALPYPIFENLNSAQIARFEENYQPELGVDLQLQPERIYSFGTTAGHLLGYVQKDDSSLAGEDAYFSYRLPDYRGVVGIEGGFDAQLHGRAGEEDVLVNNFGYRQTNNIPDAPEPGENIMLTIDLDIQHAAEKSLANHQGHDVRGAVVVMDVHSGDVLAMVSAPPINPIFSENSVDYLNNTNLQPQINRATYASYLPGSIFKPIVALAALENGLDPNEKLHNLPNPKNPLHGHAEVGNRIIDDTAPPGDYDLRRAILRSSNFYFITVGLRTGIDKIIRLGEKFHFGEREGLPTLQDAHGLFPTLERIKKSDWRDGDSANIFFGQGDVNVTPMQIACAYSAIANGGTLLWPRLVERIEPQDPVSGEMATNFPSGVVRDKIGVSQRNLEILREAMLSETEDPEGTGKPAVVGPEMRICGKTGTAQRENEHNQKIGWNYWFASFAPYENPKYAVVIMVQSENPGSGTSMCAPIAHDIYEEILKKENSKTPAQTLAKAN